MVLLSGFLALLPLAVNFWVDLPYEPIKIFLICSLAIVSGVSILVWLAGSPKIRFSSILEKLNIQDFAVVLWLVVLSLSTTLSVTPYASFWSTSVRGTGLVYYAALTVLYFVVRLFSTSKDRLLFSRISCLVAIIVSVYGIVQWLGYDFAGFENAFPLYGRTGPTRAFATLGHPNFLGVYLAIFLPFGFFVWLKDTQKIWRYLGAIAVALSAVAILLSYSRGAWLACIGGLVVTGFLWQEGIWRKFKSIILGSAAVFVIAVALIAVQSPRFLESKNSFVYRIASSFDFRQGSTLARIAEWKYASNLILKRPILGYGMDTYVEYSLNRTKDPLERNRDWAQADPSVADRLHNSVFDIIWSAGLVGLVAYLFLLGAVFKRLQNVFKQSTEMRQWLAVLTGSLFAYLFANLTGFDFSISGLWFYLLLAWVTGAEIHQKTA